MNIYKLNGGDFELVKEGEFYNRVIEREFTEKYFETEKEFEFYKSSGYCVGLIEVNNKIMLLMDDNYCDMFEDPARQI